MTFEAPEKIDLSQAEDIQKLKDKLTPEEQTRLDEYFESEKEGILYLTFQEMSELKFILGEEAAASHEADFDEFMEEQISEEVSISEILGEGEYAKKIGEFIPKMKEQIFSSESPLENLGLNEGAQDNFVSSFIMVFLDKCNENPDGIRALLEENSNILENGFDFSSIGNLDQLGKYLGIKLESFSNLRNLSDKNESIGVGNMSVPQLHISDNGETNSIFMNTEEGIEFMRKMMDETMSEEEIESYIEERNNQENIPLNNIQDIKENLEASLGTFGKNITDVIAEIKQGNPEALGVPSPTEVSGENGETVAENNETFIDMLIKMLEALTGMFIKPLKKIADSDDEIKDNSDTPEEVTPSAEEQANKKLLDLIDNLPDSARNSEIIQELKGNPELTTRVREILESISQKHNFEETLNKTFGDLEDGNIKINTIGKIFNENGFGESLGDISSLEKDIKLLEEYARYRNSSGVKGLDIDRTKWQVWAERRQAENWRVGGR